MLIGNIHLKTETVFFHEPTSMAERRTLHIELQPVSILRMMACWVAKSLARLDSNAGRSVATRDSAGDSSPDSSVPASAAVAWLPAVGGSKPIH